VADVEYKYHPAEKRDEHFDGCPAYAEILTVQIGELNMADAISGETLRRIAEKCFRHWHQDDADRHEREPED
jgi:hypothetical protein